MSRPRYIEHVTLDTGHSYRSPRSEVADSAVAALHDGLGRALRYDPAHVAVPGAPDYAYSASAEGKCLIVTIWRQIPEPDNGTWMPVVTFGVAARSLCGAKLWRTLHEPRGGLMDAAPYATADRRCPPEPWLAARMELGCVLVPHDLSWMADFERCLAWAWLSRLEARHVN